MAKGARAEAAAAVRELGERERLAALRHDLRQPLRSLRYLLAALAREPDGAEAAEIVATMGRCLDSLEAQLDALLEASAPEAGGVAARLAPVPLDPLLAQLEREFVPQADARGTRLKRVPTARVALSDPVLLETVLRNLLSNAVKYAPRARILLGCRGGRGRARIAVVDSGPGIAQARQAEIFAPFRQLDAAAEGQGLGLAIAAQVATLLDHPVGLRSEPGRGSAFWIDVPQIDPGSAAE